MKSLVYFGEHRVGLVLSRLQSFARMRARENFDSLLDGCHWIQMKSPVRDSAYHFIVQH